MAKVLGIVKHFSMVLKNGNSWSGFTTKLLSCQRGCGIINAGSITISSPQKMISMSSVLGPLSMCLLRPNSVSISSKTLIASDGEIVGNENSRT